MKRQLFRIAETGAFFVLIVLAFIGSLFIGTIAHELSHWEDYRGIADASSDSICLLDMPADGAQSVLNIHGTYYYSYDTSIPGWRTQANAIDRYTELKAYSLEFMIIGFLFIATTTLVVWRRASERPLMQKQGAYHRPVWMHAPLALQKTG